MMQNRHTFKKIKFKDYYYNYKEYMNLIDVKDLLSMQVYLKNFFRIKNSLDGFYAR